MNFFKVLGMLAAALSVAVIAVAWFFLVQQEGAQDQVGFKRPSSDSMMAVELSTERNTKQASSNFLDRPVFWESRRPVAEVEVAVVEEQAAPSQSIDDFMLVGVFHANKRENSGVIGRYKGDAIRLKMGESLQGWTLDLMAPDAAVFVNDKGEDLTVVLQHQSPKAPSRRIPPPPPLGIERPAPAKQDKE